MRVLEARFSEPHVGGHKERAVARLHCDGRRVQLESLLDPGGIGKLQDADGLLARLLLIVRASGPRPFEALAGSHRDGWLFVPVDSTASLDAADAGPSQDSLSIVLPMWNEAENIRPAVQAARHLGMELMAEGAVRGFEILVIDDCSTDATGAIADGLAGQDDRIRVMHNDGNRGLGGSLRAGFAAARGQLVLYTDADLPCDVGETRKALRLMRLYNADLVSAHRQHRTGEGALRLLYSTGYNWLVRALFGLRLRDVNFAFKLFRRRLLDDIRLESEGSFLDAELLARAHGLGMRIVQFGVDYVPRIRGTSTLARPSVIWKIVAELAMQYGEIRALRPAVEPVVELMDRPARRPRRELVSG